MSPEEAVRTRLLALSSVTDLVGTRIYQVMLPQHPTFPAVRVQLIDEEAFYTITKHNKVRRGRVQVDIFAQVTSGGDPLVSADAIANAIDGDGNGASSTGLSGWRGDLGSPSYEVKGIFRLSRDKRYEADELRLVRVRMDYDVWVEVT